MIFRLIPIILTCFLVWACSLRSLERGFYGVLQEYLQWRGIEAKSVHLPIGYSVRYLETGNPGRPVLLLLHGFGADPMTTWLDIMPQLQDDYHLLAPIMLYATQNPFRPADYVLADERQVLEAFLDRLAVEKLSIMAISSGSCVALDLALERPEMVDRLVLIAVPVNDIEPRVSKALAEQRLPEFYRDLFHNPPPMPDMVLDGQVKRIEVMGERFTQMLQEIDLGCRKVRQKLNQVKQPTLIAWGVRDVLFPLSDGRKLPKVFPDADFIFFMECGHAVTWDQPEKLGKAVEQFLKKDRNG